MNPCVASLPTKIPPAAFSLAVVGIRVGDVVFQELECAVAKSGVVDYALEPIREFPHGALVIAVGQLASTAFASSRALVAA